MQPQTAVDSSEPQGARARDAIGVELLQAGQSTLAERWWVWVGQTLARVTGSNRPASFAVSATLVLALALAIDYLLTLLLGRFRRFVFEDTLWVGYTLCFLLLMRWQFQHHLDVFRREVVPHLCDEDLNDLRGWMGWLRRLGPQAGFALFSALSGSYLSWQLVTQRGAAPGPGQVLIYLVNFGLMGMFTYLALPLILLYLRIGRYRFCLFSLVPSQSPVLVALNGLANGFALAFAAIVTLFVVLIVRVYGGSGLMGVSVLILALFTWVPTVAFFAISQSSFARIIQRVKGLKLDELRARITTIEAGADLAQREQVELLKSLMDHYQRVEGTPNSMVSLGSVIGLLNSLILPLIGLLANNVDKVLALLGLRR